MRNYASLRRILLVPLTLAVACANDDITTPPVPVVLHPVCTKDAPTRVDYHTPQCMVEDWDDPVRLDEPVNSYCPADAIEISRDGQYLYYLFTEDVGDSLTAEQMLARENNTYRAHRNGGPGDFDTAVYYDLGKGTTGSYDAELSFTPDGTKVYFHSTRLANTGYQHDPYVDDPMDIYVADIVNGVPDPARNLGAPINTVYLDGEHAIHPDGVTLYFASNRPGGRGGVDIWTSQYDGSAWSTPIPLDSMINTEHNELQPAFTSDGDTMYFVSDQSVADGLSIYRSRSSDLSWSEPQLVIRGIVGEPSITADGQLLYFVHVLTDTLGRFDADIWYCERK